MEPQKITLDDVTNKTDIIFVIGMSATGKTTTSRIIGKKLDYHVIHMDDVIMKIAETHPEGKKITKMYKKGKYLKEKELAITIIKKLVEKHTKVIIEGTIWDPYIIDSISNNKPYQIIYVKSSSKKRYMNNMYKRVKNDIRTNQTTFSIVWKALTKEEIYDDEKLCKFLKKLVDFRETEHQEAYEIYKDYDLKMFVN